MSSTTRRRGKFARTSFLLSFRNLVSAIVISSLHSLEIFGKRVRPTAPVEPILSVNRDLSSVSDFLTISPNCTRELFRRDQTFRLLDHLDHWGGIRIIGARLRVEKIFTHTVCADCAQRETRTLPRDRNILVASWNTCIL